MPKINTTSGPAEYVGQPDICPFCHHKMTPVPIYGHCTERLLEIFFYCPNADCQRSFIGYYYEGKTLYEYTGQTSNGVLFTNQFSKTISSISKAFILIYNQAYSAEQQKLNEICGVGYRKALEFLIKDYIILNNPDDREQIEKKLLGQCISDHINDARIISVVKRAVWLGNDETHYVRKWEGKNLEDLKRLIDLTVHWIEMELLTKNIISEMPE